MEIVLVEPDIPANTGNIIRLCAATGSTLHLVEPLGFRLTDRYLKRAALDGWERIKLVRHPTVEALLATSDCKQIFLFSKKGTIRYDELRYQPGDVLVFGSESKGLPQWLLDMMRENTAAIPMRENSVRSLNLSSAVAIVLFEALRQISCRAPNA